MRVLRHRSAGGLEDRGVFSDVAARCEAESAGELARLVGEDVSEDVARHDDAVILRVLDEPHGGRVGVLLDALDAVLLVLLGDFEEDSLHHSVGLADDVLFLYLMRPLPALIERMNWTYKKASTS